ncbi:MAG: GHKL domain-containing protein [Candidatus Aminicenantes bacterium]|nr:GHKL domain-containing protein [Candidatus Aminicenantes bacterium]
MLGVVLILLVIQEVEREKLLWEKTRQEATIQTARRSVEWIISSVHETEKRIIKQLEITPYDNTSLTQICRDIKNNEQFVSEIIIVEKDGRIEFPLFIPIWEIPQKKEFGPALREKTSHALLVRAEAYEFRQKKFRPAAETYEELHGIVSQKKARAQILNRAARCYKKAGLLDKAISTYLSLARDHDSETDENSLPMGLLARFQGASIYQEKGDLFTATKTRLELYNRLLDGDWRLTEAQFHHYAARMEETIPSSLSALEDHDDSQTLKNNWKNISDTMAINRLRMQDAALLYDEFRSELSTGNKQNNNPINEMIYVSKFLTDKWFMVGRLTFPDSTSLLIRFDHETLLENLVSFGNPDDGSTKIDPIRIVDENGILIQKNIPDSAKALTEPAFSLRLESPLPPWTLRILQTDSQEGAREFRKRKVLYLSLVLIVLGALSFGGFMGLRGMGKELELARLKSDFVATVSHELRTPLTSIRYMLDLLRRGRVREDDKRQSFYETLTIESERLSDIIENLLDFSKIEAGMKQYDLKPIEPTAFASDLAQRTQERIGPKGFRLEAEITKDLPPAKIDKDSFSRALYNLLDNAIKYSGSSRVIYLKAWADSKNIYWEVKDNGIGIDLDEQKRIFDKFYRSSEPLDDNIKGSGIGLTLVKHIAEAHGGEIMVTSKKGYGSTFTLKIPRMIEKV